MLPNRSLKNMLVKRRSSNSQTGKEHCVWMVNHYAIAPDMPGGSRHFELASLLREHGWQTIIFATPFNHKTAQFDRPVSMSHPVQEETVDGVRFRWLYSLPYSRNDWRRYANMLSFAAVVIWAGLREPSPQVVIGSSPHLLAALGGWFVAKRHRVPFILEIRDLWPDTLIQMGLRNPAVIKPLSVIERFLYARADQVLVLAEGIGDKIRAKGVSGQHITFLPNASLSPAPLDDEKRNATRQRFGWSDKTIAIYAGAHGPANALEHTVEAARLLEQHDGIHFVLVGDGPTRKRLIAQANGLTNITFMDPIPKSEISNLLRAADIGLLTLQRADVFTGARPNKLFDYMANGLAIVNTVPGEAQSVVDEAGAGVFAEPEDQNSLARAVASLSADDPMRQGMAESGYSYVCQNLTREETACTLASVLDSVSPPEN